MECEERKKLLLEYERTTRAASDAAEALAKIAGTTALSGYRLLLDELTRTEAAVSQARLEFDNHIIKHRCTGSPISKLTDYPQIEWIV